MTDPRRLEPDDLKLTAKYWWTLDEIAERLRVGKRQMQNLIQPYRGRCHLGRLGKHPRVILKVPVEVVRALDRERRANACQAQTST